MQINQRIGGQTGPKPSKSASIGKAAYHRLFSMDSGLEAFSLNPTHGSFSALTFQSTDLPIM